MIHHITSHHTAQHGTYSSILLYPIAYLLPICHRHNDVKFNPLFGTLFPVTPPVIGLILVPSSLLPAPDSDPDTDSDPLSFLCGPGRVRQMNLPLLMSFVTFVSGEGDISHHRLCWPLASYK